MTTKNIEIVREIITVASILMKFSREDIVEDRQTFIEFLNEIGIRNDGRQLNQNSFKKLVSNLTVEEKKTLISEFNEGYENIYRHLVMHSNN
ncbi:anti-sigma 70 protein [Escherichia phage vB_EcoM_ESCO47]|nr:anti-sigma 70 protein [Escherichia phage vB_EcoM_ESCO47]